MELHCETDTSLCTCIKAGGSAAATPGVACTPDSVGGGKCCYEPGYPNDSFATCQCMNWGCFNGSVCSCGPNGGSDTSCDTKFAHCCVDTNQVGNPINCQCSNLPCTASETEIDHCGLDMAGCATGETRIDRCTP